MKKKVDALLIQKLSNSENFQGFLHSMLTDRGAKARLSRKAGFTSRSYLTEVLSGKKGLSRDSLNRLKTSLNLPKPLPQLFEYLVWMSEPELRPVTVDPQKVKALIAEARRGARSFTEENKSPVGVPVKFPQLFQVYAALGLPQEGATLEEVVKRTRLDQSSALRHIKALMEMKAVTENNSRYFAPVSRADHLNMTDSAALSEMVKQVGGDLLKNRDRNLKDPNNLTLYSAFSVRQHQLPELKKKINEALFAILDEYQDDQGDQVQQIFVSLHGHPFG